MGLADLLAPGVDQLLQQVAGEIAVRGDATTWQLAPTWTPGRVRVHDDGEDAWVVVEHVAATNVRHTPDLGHAMAASTDSRRSSATILDDIVLHRRVLAARDLTARSLHQALHDTSQAADVLRQDVVDRLGLGAAPYSDPRFVYWGQRAEDPEPQLPGPTGGYL